MKEELLFRINTLCGNLSRYDYHTSLAEFLPVLHDVVYLLFGSLAKGESFIEYAVRVDPDFGFFWYYINSLPPHDSWSEDKCRAAVLLGNSSSRNFRGPCGYEPRRNQRQSQGRVDAARAPSAEKKTGPSSPCATRSTRGAISILHANARESSALARAG
jgi:hypothetical protein